MLLDFETIFLIRYVLICKSHPLLSLPNFAALLLLFLEHGFYKPKKLTNRTVGHSDLLNKVVAVEVQDTSSVDDPAVDKSLAILRIVKIRKCRVESLQNIDRNYFVQQSAVRMGSYW